LVILFFISTKKQRSQKIDTKKPKDAFTSLISNTMNRLKNAGIPIFIYNPDEREQSSELWKIREGPKIYLSNIQEAQNYYNQALQDLEENKNEDAFGNLKNAFVNDGRNIDVCIMLLSFLLKEDLQFDINADEASELMHNINNTLLDEEEKYDYFKENVYNMMTGNLIYDVTTLRRARSFQSPFTKESNKIKNFLFEIEEWDKKRNNELDKPIEIKNIKNNDEKRLYYLIKSIAYSNAGNIPEKTIIDFADHEIITNYLKFIALNHISDKLTENEKNEELKTRIQVYKEIIYIELNTKKIGFRRYVLNFRGIKKHLQKIIERSSYWKEYKRQERVADVDYDRATGEDPSHKDEYEEDH
jgi:hypothetical protein